MAVVHAAQPKLVWEFPKNLVGTLRGQWIVAGMVPENRRQSGFDLPD
jgi:hypothetical protein